MGYIAAITVLLHFSVLSVLGQTPTPIDVPVSYVTAKLQHPAGNQIDVWNVPVCIDQQKKYNGATFVADFNLPSNLDWIHTLGVVFATVSNSTTFSPALCTNVEGSNLRNSCHFIYESAMGPNLYIQIRAGDESNIQYSTGISFVKSGTRLSPVNEVTLSPQQVDTTRHVMARPAKAVAVQSLVPIVRLQESGTVPTGSTILYSFSLCETPKFGNNSQIQITIIGEQPGDAFSTYVCKAANCVPDNANVVHSDNLDSSINVVTVPYYEFAPEGTVYVLVFGFGGKRENQFSFSAVVSAPSSSYVCGESSAGKRTQTCIRCARAMLSCSVSIVLLLRIYL